MQPLRRSLLLTLASLAGGIPAAGAARASRVELQTDAPPVSLLLAGVWGDQIDPSPYLVSEKYDGVRALWDGQGLRFRSGRAVIAPAWFTAALPAQPLDGELWLGRQRFDALSSIVRNASPQDALWQRPVRDGEELYRWLAEVVAQGGEGLALHMASASYQTGRSEALLKLKPQLDTEATVVAHLPGKGKYAGLTGALWVRTPEVREFALGLPDSLRCHPPPTGSVVTYRFRDFTASGLPRFASFLRVHDAA